MKREIPSDLKCWYALSCPIAGLRFDRRTLELLDADGDGHIRSEEVRAALAFLSEKGVTETRRSRPRSRHNAPRCGRAGRRSCRSRGPRRI